MRFANAIALCISCFALCTIALPAEDASATRPQLPSTFGDQGLVNVPSFADKSWTQIYQDTALQSLIRTAIGENFDAQIAAQRVLQASEQVTITGANQLPLLTAELSAPSLKINGPLPLIFPHQEFGPNLTGTVSYEFDLWGKLRSATAATRAQLLASEDAREVIVVTLVSDVASAYFDLRAFDQELDVYRQLLAARRKSLALARDRFEQGQVSQLDVDQAQGLVEDVESLIPEVQIEIKDAEITISTLEGVYPQTIPRGLPLTQQLALPAVPSVGVPSALLERRPDIREAEEQLAAQHAQITVTRSALFPRFNLTGSAGTGTYVVDGIFYGPHGLFSLIPSLLYTIFNAGAQKAQMRTAQDVERQDLYNYLSIVHQSFSEVSSALSGYHNLAEQVAQLQRLGGTYRKTVDIATLRYYEGEGSYTDVLDSESRYLTASVDLVQAELAERLALVHLYEALGGGWQK